MAHRLTYEEFEFLQQSLQALEDIGSKLLRGERVNGETIDFFSPGKHAAADRIDKLQRLRRKIEIIAGD